MHKAKENYRIFNDQQHRADSIDGSLSESISGVNPAAMAYDNPVFGTADDRSDGAHDPELNITPFSAPRGGGPGVRLGGPGGESLNSFPMKNGSLFNHNKHQRSDSSSSDPRSFERLPSLSDRQQQADDLGRRKFSATHSSQDEHDDDDKGGSIVNF